MTGEEAKARWICCPLCDKHKCERGAKDCDVRIYMKTNPDDIISLEIPEDIDTPGRFQTKDRKWHKGFIGGML